MSSSFLGSDKHVTLLEADCTLLGSFHQAIRDHAEKIKSEFEEKSEETPEKTDYVDRLLSKEDIEANTEDTAFRPDSWDLEINITLFDIIKSLWIACIFCHFLLILYFCGVNVISVKKFKKKTEICRFRLKRL